MVTAAVETDLPLEWSFAVQGTVDTTTVDTDDEDAWQFPLQWSFLVDIDPPDDVEDP